MRQKKKVAEVQIYKSAAFIDDSDDDDDADAAFFAREKRLREEMQVMAEKNGHVMLDKGTRKRRREDKRKDKGKKGEDDANGEEPATQVDEDDVEMVDPDSSDEEDDTPRKKGISPLDSNESDGVGGEGSVVRPNVEMTQATQRTKVKRVIESDSEDEQRTVSP
jgi:replication fork protection complex subunit Tof1/Swi1